MGTYQRISKLLFDTLKPFGRKDKSAFIPRQTVAPSLGKLSLYISHKNALVLQQQCFVVQIKRSNFSSYVGAGRHKKLTTEFAPWIKQDCSENHLKRCKITIKKDYSTTQKDLQESENYLDVKDDRLQDILSSDMIVKTNFINESEEESLLAEVEKYMRRLRYEFDHWDNVSSRKVFGRIW